MEKRKSPPLPRVKQIKYNAATTENTRFPFYIKAVGFSSDRTLLLEKELELSDHFLLYMVSGDAVFSFQNTARKVKEKDLIFVSCTSPLKLTTNHKQNCAYFWGIINGDSLKLYYNIIRSQKCIQKTNPLSPILGLFIALYNLDYDGSMHSHMEACHLLHEILHQSYLISHSINQAKAKVPVQDTEVKCAIAFIEGNYTNKKLSITDICNNVCLSRYYFCKIFKEHTGITLLRYLNQYRVHRSKDLLLYSKLSVDSIASTVGFSNALTYIRNFKNEMTLTPSEFRKNY